MQGELPLGKTDICLRLSFFFNRSFEHWCLSHNGSIVSTLFSMPLRLLSNSYSSSQSLKRTDDNVSLTKVFLESSQSFKFIIFRIQEII